MIAADEITGKKTVVKLYKRYPPIKIVAMYAFQYILTYKRFQKRHNDLKKIDSISRVFRFPLSLTIRFCFSLKLADQA